jgi:hypothetical protein
MAFTDFTLEMVLEQFQLVPERVALFGDVRPSPPSAWLLETLERYKPLAFTSEKSRSEFLIAPILTEARAKAGNQFAIYSGQRLDADSSLGLVGECDFILAKTPPIFVLRAPIVSVVEAKKLDVEAGLGQCAAQLLAARQFNHKHQLEFPALYGASTTGEVWQFLKLEQNKLQLDTQRYTLDALPVLLGVFGQILSLY